MVRTKLVSIATECPFVRDCDTLAMQDGANDTDGGLHDYSREISDANGCYDEGYVNCPAYKTESRREK